MKTIFSLIMSAFFGMLLMSCDKLRKQTGSAQDDAQEIEFVKPVGKESQPMDVDEDFTENPHGTPIEGRQSTPKDELVHESTPEEDALWN